MSENLSPGAGLPPPPPGTPDLAAIAQPPTIPVEHVRALRNHIRWSANVVHQAWHHDLGELAAASASGELHEIDNPRIGWRECTQAHCAQARMALEATGGVDG